MRTKKITVFGLMAAALAAVVVVVSRQPEENRAQNVSLVEPTNVVNAVPSPNVQRVNTTVEESKPVVVENKPGEVPVAQKKVTTKPSGKPAKQKPPIQDPDARDALSLVGADPVAEEYWSH